MIGVGIGGNREILVWFLWLVLVLVLQRGTTKFTKRESMLMEDDEMLFVFSKTKLKGILVISTPTVRKPSKF